MPVAQLTRKAKIGGLLLIEWFVLGWAVLACGLYTLLDVPARSPIGLYWERVSGIFPCYLIALLLALLILRLHHIALGRAQHQLIPHRHTWSEFKLRYLTRSEVIFDLRLLNIICILFVVFVNLKHLIPFINPRLYDTRLANAELRLLGGSFAGDLLQASVGIEYAPLLSEIYVAFYGYVLFLVYFFVVIRDRNLAQRFFLTFASTWFLGLLVVYVFPTQGPVFYHPDQYTHLPWTQVSDMQLKLWKHALVLQDQPFHPTATYLISGLPSLHFAIPIVGSLSMWKVSKVFACVSWLFAALTGVTTLYFGWHWLVDDVASVLLVFFAVYAVRRILAPVLVYVPQIPNSTRPGR